MRRALRYVLVAVLVVAVVAVGAFAALLYDFTRVEPDSVEYTYRYEVAVQPDQRLDDVTLYVPLPVENASSPVGEAIAANATVEGSGAWTTHVADTQYGPMLAIEAATLPPRYETRPAPQPLPEDETTVTPTPGENVTVLRAYELAVELPADAPIDTRSPVGVEPTFKPRTSATEVDCTVAATDATVCREVGSRLYAGFDAPENATTTVLVRYEGWNTWFAGGWTGNSFEQQFHVAVEGPADGWQAVTVAERVGFGRYPTPTP